VLVTEKPNKGSVYVCLQKNCKLKEIKTNCLKLLQLDASVARNSTLLIRSRLGLHIQGVPKKRIPSFIFGITSVIQHRF